MIRAPELLRAESAAVVEQAVALMRERGGERKAEQQPLPEITGPALGALVYRRALATIARLRARSNKAAEDDRAGSYVEPPAEVALFLLSAAADDSPQVRARAFALTASLAASVRKLYEQEAQRDDESSAIGDSHAVADARVACGVTLDFAFAILQKMIASQVCGDQRRLHQALEKQGEEGEEEDVERHALLLRRAAEPWEEAVKAFLCFTTVRSSGGELALDPRRFEPKAMCLSRDPSAPGEAKEKRRKVPSCVRCGRRRGTGGCGMRCRLRLAVPLLSGSRGELSETELAGWTSSSVSPPLRGADKDAANGTSGDEEESKTDEDAGLRGGCSLDPLRPVARRADPRVIFALLLSICVGRIGWRRRRRRRQEQFEAKEKLRPFLASAAPFLAATSSLDDLPLPSSLHESSTCVDAAYSGVARGGPAVERVLCAALEAATRMSVGEGKEEAFGEDGATLRTFSLVAAAPFTLGFCKSKSGRGFPLGTLWVQGEWQCCPTLRLRRGRNNGGDDGEEEEGSTALFSPLPAPMSPTQLAEAARSMRSPAAAAVLRSLLCSCAAVSVLCTARAGGLPGQARLDAAVISKEKRKRFSSSSSFPLSALQAQVSVGDVVAATVAAARAGPKLCDATAAAVASLRCAVHPLTSVPDTREVKEGRERGSRAYCEDELAVLGEALAGSALDALESSDCARECADGGNATLKEALELCSESSRLILSCSAEGRRETEVAVTADQNNDLDLRACFMAAIPVEIDDSLTAAVLRGERGVSLACCYGSSCSAAMDEGGDGAHEACDAVEQKALELHTKLLELALVRIGRTLGDDGSKIALPRGVAQELRRHRAALLRLSSQIVQHGNGTLWQRDNSLRASAVEGVESKDSGVNCADKKSKDGQDVWYSTTHLDLLMALTSAQSARKDPVVAAVACQALGRTCGEKCAAVEFLRGPPTVASLAE